MLQRSEITAWRAHADWSRDSQIEQDLLITRAMVAIFSDPFLSEHVAMRGGTIRLTVRNAVLPSSVAQMKFVYSPTTPPPARMTVKVEVNFSEREPLYRIVDLPFHPPLAELHAPVRLRSYDLDEMLGTKMRSPATNPGARPLRPRSRIVPAGCGRQAP